MPRPKSYAADSLKRKTESIVGHSTQPLHFRQSEANHKLTILHQAILGKL
nr:hypothetical protein [Staphylococcus haemolyticus]